MLQNLPSYGKVVKASFLLLFLISSILSLFHPTTQSAIIAGLSLAAFIAFDVVCAFRDHKVNQGEWRDAIESLKKVTQDLQNDHNNVKEQFKSIRDDLSVAKIGTALGQMRK